MTYSVTICENASPPTTAMPSGRRDAALAPTPIAIGSVPTIAETVVIMIGRKRTLAACTIASAGVVCCSRSSAIAKSIIMIAFFFTMPISMMMPT